MTAPEFQTLMIKHRMHVRGVIQVGAHHGQEDPIWIAAGIKHRVYFEPVGANFEILKQRVRPDGVNVLAFETALGNINGFLPMNIETSNGGQSCSLLTPREHLAIRPDIEFTHKETVKVRRLDDIVSYAFPAWFCAGDYNFLFMDAQGYELHVLYGAEHTLRGIDYIFTEINRGEVFDGCARVEMLDSYLAKFGFSRVETIWHGGLWGDGFYIRK
jgi:FkbM family methyltransferase